LILVSDRPPKWPKSNEWLGWQDSNLRMPVPKTGALPLGDTPTSEYDLTRELALYRRETEWQGNNLPE
jgi:hypothetical protein